MESKYSFEVWEYSGEVDPGFKKLQYNSDQGDRISLKAEIIKKDNIYVVRCDFDKTKLKREEKEEQKREQDFILKIGEFNGLQLERISETEKEEVTRIEIVEKSNVSIYVFDDLLFYDHIEDIDMSRIFALLSLESNRIDLSEYDPLQGNELKESKIDLVDDIDLQNNRISVNSSAEENEIVRDLHQMIVS